MMRGKGETKTKIEIEREGMGERERYIVSKQNTHTNAKTHNPPAFPIASLVGGELFPLMKEWRRTFEPHTPPAPFFRRVVLPRQFPRPILQLYGGIELGLLFFFQIYHIYLSVFRGINVR
jgi:hypothetical protein